MHIYADQSISQVGGKSGWGEVDRFNVMHSLCQSELRSLSLPFVSISQVLMLAQELVFSFPF